MKNIERAFTLAEVMLTLVILGVVAAITVSSLSKNTFEKQAITKLKKNYALIENVMAIAQLENGPISDWGYEKGNPTQGQEADVIAQKLAQYLNVAKVCNHDDTSCATSQTYKTLNPSVNWVEESPNNEVFAKILLKDGSLLIINTLDKRYRKSLCGDQYHENNTCAYIKVDVNGKSKPNRIGVDTFDFIIGPNTIIPGGAPEDGFANNANTYCSLSSTSNYNGIGCTYILLTQGKMTYLHNN